MKEGQEVLRLVFPTCDESAKLFEPSEQAFDFPTTLVAPHSTSVLSASDAVGPLGGNQFDVTLFTQPLGQRVTVEGLVADQVWWKRVGYCFVESLLDKGDVVSRTISNANGERKTSAVCKRHDLRRIAGTALSDGGSPFFAPT